MNVISVVRKDTEAMWLRERERERRTECDAARACPNTSRGDTHEAKMAMPDASRMRGESDTICE